MQRRHALPALKIRSHSRDICQNFPFMARSLSKAKVASPMLFSQPSRDSTAGSAIVARVLR